MKSAQKRIADTLLNVLGHPNATQCQRNVNLLLHMVLTDVTLKWLRKANVFGKTQNVANSIVITWNQSTILMSYVKKDFQFVQISL